MWPYGELRWRGARKRLLMRSLDGPINKYVAPSYVLRRPPLLVYDAERASLQDAALGAVPRRGKSQDDATLGRAAMPV